MNRVVAEFVDKYDGPDSPLIAYYAGHAIPGDWGFGGLEPFWSMTQAYCTT